MRFEFTDILTLDQLIRKVAAAEILPRFGTLTAAEVDSKASPDDLVTVADTATEAALTAALLQAFPGADVVGEETIRPDYDYRAADLLFVIDPIDGTWPFAKGMPIFGSMVSVFAKGVPLGGVIHYPMLGDSLLCRSGSGVVLRNAHGQDQRLAPLLQGAELKAGCFGYCEFPMVHWQDLLEKLREVPRLMSLHCSAQEYRLLLTGAVDFVISRGAPTVWDHGVGQAMLAELGGQGHIASGTALLDRPQDDVLISARSPEIVAKLLALLPPR